MTPNKPAHPSIHPSMHACMHACIHIYIYTRSVYVYVGFIGGHSSHKPTTAVARSYPAEGFPISGDGGDLLWGHPKGTGNQRVSGAFHIKWMVNN